MYRNIEIVGMRKNRDLRIVITIIILAIISIIVCLGIIFYNKKMNSIEVASTNNLDSEEIIYSEQQEKKENEGNNESDDNSENKDNSEDIGDENSDNNKVQEITEQQKEFISKIENIYNGEEGKRVFLTFDDGPSNEVTPHILDILKKYDIKATFFVLGNRVKANPELVKRAYEEGHYIANHGYSHKYSKIYESVDSVLEEYNKTEALIKEAIGNSSYSSNLFRFPGGSKGGPYEDIKKEARKRLKETGIAYLDWSALTYDAEGANTKEKILNNLKKTINGWDNVVILMHDAADKKITYETLEDVIKYLQDEGYTFKNIYDLM